MNRTTAINAIIILMLLVVFGSCSYTAAACWHRGGTVLKNAFDWPTCVTVSNR